MPRVLVLVATVALALAGCSAPTASTAGAPGDAPGSFVNKVWVVSDSPAVAPGTLFVFLSEGTLVIASPHGKPALGRWTHRDGAFTMVEDGITYQVDILRLSRDEFRIRSHNPGQPVEMRLVPGDRRVVP
jgi:hypothetical protein